MKPYQTIPILDCGEPLVPIPLDQFVVMQPHPYQVLGAPYGQHSPYVLRQGVLAALILAQTELTTHQPNWRIQIFDAFRPVAVQRFMVNHAFQQLLQTRQLQEADLNASQWQELMAEVYQFWALPSDNPATPPPHSTGAALDVTLVDATGKPVDMGSPIDELSPRSYPDYFGAGTAANPQVHANRTLLHQVMATADFCRHPHEWWHFSLGDQLWAWTRQQTTGQSGPARYGMALDGSAV